MRVLEDEDRKLYKSGGRHNGQNLRVDENQKFGIYNNNISILTKNC